MIQQGLARKYARALFSWACDSDKLEKTEAEFNTLSTALQEDEKTMKILTHPLVEQEDKRGILLELAKDSQKELQNLLQVLVDQKRIDIIPQIFTEYQKLAHQKQNIQIAKVFTAVELPMPKRDELASALGKMLKKDVRLEVQLDKSIIGGVVAHIGDTIIDASVTGYLGGLQEKLTSPT